MRWIFLIVFMPSLGSGAEPARAAQPAELRVQAHFRETFATWQKLALLTANSKIDPTQAEALVARDMKVVILPTLVPSLRERRRLDGTTLFISVGWLVLVEDLLRAEAVTKAVGRNPGGVNSYATCLKDYAALVRVVLKSYREGEAAASPQPSRAWPRLAELVESTDGPVGCRGITRADLARLQIEDFVSDGLTAMAVWLLTSRMTATAVHSVPEEVFPPTKAIALEQSAAWQPARDVFELLVPPFDRAVDPRTTKLSRAKAKAADTLRAFGLAEPSALRWLREDATSMFDRGSLVLLEP